MGRGDATRELIEKWSHYFRELGMFDHVQNLLQLVQEHYL